MLHLFQHLLLTYCIIQILNQVQDDGAEDDGDPGFKLHFFMETEILNIPSLRVSINFIKSNINDD